MAKYNHRISTNNYQGISANYLDELNKDRNYNEHPLKQDRPIIIVKDGLNKKIMKQIGLMNRSTQKKPNRIKGHINPKN